MNEQPLSALLREIVEPRRKRLGLSLRRAAGRAGMSEASWRQLVRGGVNVRDEWITREPRPDQLLVMAAAVSPETLAEVTEAVDPSPEEVHSARSRVHIPDPAEEEIMASKHLRPEEKLRLLEALRRVRSHPASEDAGESRAG
jgi:transcriptional regulator with XRE-family HTH domain